MAFVNRLGIAALLVGLAAVSWYFFDKSRDAREAKSVGVDISRTITSSFASMNALKVGTVTGDVMTSSNTTALFGTMPVIQRTRAPYSVDYFVDLSRLTNAAYRWNAKARVMSIDIPEITIAAPNIDTARATVTQQGLYISRSAGIAMQRQAVERATAAARKTAQDPAFRAQARDNARKAIAQLVAQPLNAAGLGTVKIAVRFPDDPKPASLDRKVWDESTPLSEILSR